MSIQSRRLNNVLLHWVQRHRSMTTLFHSHSRPVQPNQTIQTSQSPDSETIIQAKSLDVEAPSLPNTPASSPKATAVRRANPTLPVDSSINDTPAAASPSKEASTQSDPGWKRLQTIFRKHQEQENPTAAPVKSPEPSPATNPDIQRIAEPPESAKAVDNTQQSAKLSAPQQIQTPSVLQRKTNAAETPGASLEYAAPKPERRKQTSNTDIPHIDPPAASSSETPKAAIKQVSSEPNATVIPSEEHTIDFGAPDMEEESDQMNALPLESVWNVQRMEEPESTEQTISLPTRSSPPPLHSAIPAQALQRSELEPDVSSSSLQNESKFSAESPKLQAESGIAADGEFELRAPVEILAPSRPRPAPVNPVTPSVTIQRQTQDQPPAQEAPTDQLVETAIGPLPADLWQLIGQKPPEKQPRQPMVHEAAPDSIHRQTENAEQQEETISHETTSQPMTSVRMVDFPAPVQRRPAATDTEPSSQQPSDVTPSSSQQAAESELDVDELARKVYARIRQRLSTEWERLRRK